MTNAANRTLWTVIGLLLTVAGVAGVLANRGWLPGVDADAPLAWPELREWWQDTDPWGLVVVGLLGLVAAVLGLILLLAELRRRPARALAELRLAHRQPGSTRVPGGVIGHGLERDLARDPGIRHAAVAVTGAAPGPDLWIQLDVEQRADFAAIREHVDEALDRFSRTYGLRPRRLDITARVVGPAPARVR
ncbi:MAG: hypothetical protein GEV12_16375 [Micromonosporaceae bacterium]|nr:hypothetical protein [Micromonosporaceae bacterium]